MASLKDLKTFVVRRRFHFLNLASVLGLTLGVLYLGLNVDIFANGAHRSPRAEELEIDEALLVAAVLFAGLIWAGRRLLRERRAEAEQQIRALAFQDVLTGLPNRRQFDEALNASIAAPPGADASHGVLLLDLNGFKKINDVHGHPVGDEVLVHVATRLTRAVRHGDVVARLGGDEFAILATQLAGPEAATGLALRIIEELSSPVLAGGREHQVGAAIGIALIPQDGTDPAEILRKADIALYRGKGQGRSAMRFFEAEMDAHVQERDHMERELRRAVTTGEISPYYQPLVDLKTGQVQEFEALARWVHPELGVVEPARFIPLAEDTGLIGELTDTLLAQACAEAATWPADVKLAFNISPVLLHDPGFALRIVGLLGRTGLAPSRLELEITESALVRDLEGARSALGALRKVGVKIALDDFGTGYSSLYHLRNFKLDKIKIDRSFIDAMACDADSAAIVRALVGLGAGLGLEVTAEGVETEEQRQLLADQGCGQGQGFLYSEAITGEAARALLAGPQRRRSRG